MVVPAVYMFSGEAGTKASGAGLMFVTLPKVFGEMRGGQFIGLLFFVLVFFAALTSSISVMEAIVSSLMDRFKISRVKGVDLLYRDQHYHGRAVFPGKWDLVRYQNPGMDFLTFFDYVSNSVLMPIVGAVHLYHGGMAGRPEKAGG